ncbi:ATP-binding protein [Chitinilyticum piscinae]|uniref:histidine kinase n=1 Tax=Chitinilyticum piscinae TaxID=2866724 RepID=A0A8J7FRC1_9NEIS|nr:ATP-binding protein [Chitinilyticum piscinae]MBE9609426.1 GAF domain-containing protein [Chitinilyticum piscinae]
MSRDAINASVKPLQISSELHDAVVQIGQLVHSRREEGFTLCEQTLQRARELHDDLAFISVAQHYALLIDQRGYPDEAINLLYEAMQLAQSHHLFEAEAQLLNLIGRSLYTRAEYRQAMQAWASSLECAELAGDHVTWIYAKIGIGQIYDALGDSAHAVEVLKVAAAQAEKYDAADLILNAQLNLGVNLYRQGLLEEAEHAYGIVLAYCRQLGHEDDEGETLFRLAEIDLARDQVDHAQAKLIEARRLCTATGHWWGMANICMVSAKALERQSKLHKAIRELQRGLLFAKRAGALHIECRIWEALSHTAELAGRWEQALRASRSAVQIQMQIALASNAGGEARELENLAGLTRSPTRQLLEISTDPVLEKQSKDAILAILVRNGCEILRASQCSIWLDDPLHGRMVCHCRLALDGQELVAGEVIDRGNASDFLAELASGESIIAHNAKYHRYTWRLYQHYLEQRNIQALLVQPLLLGGSLQGLLWFEQLERQRNWTMDEQLLAGQLATVVVRVLASHEREAFMQDVAKLNAALQESNDRLEDRVQQRTAELERANQELKKVMEHLVQSEKIAALGNLVAGLAHELNTPLGINLVSATTLEARHADLKTSMAAGSLKKSQLEHYLDEATDALQLIVRNSRRASDMIANFKQVAVDTSSNQRRHFDVRITVEEVLWALSPQYKKRPITFELDLPEGMLIDSYPGAFEQIITNFISNSLVHAFDPHQVGTISIRAHLENGRCRLHYRDTGKGIANALHSKVFDPFFTTRFGQGGSGLGLYLVYSLATGALGGDVRLLPGETGSGVCFELEFPVCAPQPAERGLS